MASTVSEALLAALNDTQELPPEDLGIPAHVVEWVEREYKHWQDNPAWRFITLPTEQDVEELMESARKYVRYGRQAGRLTVQQKAGYPQKVKGGFRLAYRVRNPIQRERSSS